MRCRVLNGLHREAQAHRLENRRQTANFRVAFSGQRAVDMRTVELCLKHSTCSTLAPAFHHQLPRIYDTGYPVDDFARRLLVQSFNVFYLTGSGAEIEGAHLIADGNTGRVVSRNDHGQTVLSGMIAATGDRHTDNQTEFVNFGRCNNHKPMSIPYLVSRCRVGVDPVNVAW